MDLDYKESLSSRLLKHAPDFDIGDVVFNSFSRDFGYVLRLSASDAVYALMALVESPHSEDLILAASVLASDDSDPTQIWLKNFYAAFDALELYSLFFC